MGVDVGTFLYTMVLFITRRFYFSQKGFVRTGARNSIIPAVTYPGRQTYLWPFLPWKDFEKKCC